MSHKRRTVYVLEMCASARIRIFAHGVKLRSGRLTNNLDKEKEKHRATEGYEPQNSKWHRIGYRGYEPQHATSMFPVVIIRYDTMYSE